MKTNRSSITVGTRAFAWVIALLGAFVTLAQASPVMGAPWRPGGSIIIPPSSGGAFSSLKPQRGGAEVASVDLRGGKGAYVAEGRILDEEMNSVAGAVVNFGRHEATTDGDGTFAVEGVHRGFHEVVVTAHGFAVERSEILVDERMGPIEMMLRRAEGFVRQGPRVERSASAEAAIERRFGETFLEAAPTLSGTSGLIDLPDTGVMEAGRRTFGAHFMRLDGVTTNADMFAYKYNQGIGDSMEFSLSFVDSKLGAGSSEISTGSGILGMKYKVPENLGKVDFALVGQVSQESSQFFGIADFTIPDGKLSVSLKNDDAGRNAALNLGVELAMPDFDRFVGLGRSTFIFETEQADAKFNMFNAGLRHRTGRHQVIDLFVLQDRRVKDDNGNRSRNQRTYGLGGSLEF